MQPRYASLHGRRVWVQRGWFQHKMHSVWATFYTESERWMCRWSRRDHPNHHDRHYYRAFFPSLRHVLLYSARRRRPIWDAQGVKKRSILSSASETGSRSQNYSIWRAGGRDRGECMDACCLKCFFSEYNRLFSENDVKTVPPLSPLGARLPSSRTIQRLNTFLS